MCNRFYARSCLFFEQFFSMKAALEQLGCGPTYHMLENIFHGHWKHWVAMGSANSTEKEKILKQALSGYNSCVDFPTCAFFDDLLRINPEAKVVLTVRDSPQVLSHLSQPK